jgi:hypothetical protein
VREALEQRRRNQSGPDHLQGDGTARIVLLRLVDRPHASLAQQTQDAIAADPRRQRRAIGRRGRVRGMGSLLRGADQGTVQEARVPPFARRRASSANSFSTAARPHLEVLEDRTAPAVLTVNSLSDSATPPSNVLTLREALQVVDTGSTASLSSQQLAQINQTQPLGSDDTIVFDPSLTASGPATIDLGIVGDDTFGPSALLVTKSVTILGPSGANGLTLARDTTADPNGLQLFYVASGGSLTLQNLTLSGGLAQGGSSAVGGGVAGLGGAVVNAGSLTLLDDTLTDNQAIGGSSVSNLIGFGGGGLGGNAPGAGVGGPPNGGVFAFHPGGFGGAIFNLNGTVIVTNSTLASNIASTSGGAIYNLGDNGPNYGNGSAQTTFTIQAASASIQFMSVSLLPNLLSRNRTETETISVHVSSPSGTVNQGTIQFTVDGQSVNASVDAHGNATANLSVPLKTTDSPQSISAAFSDPNFLPDTLTQIARWTLWNKGLSSVDTFAADGSQSVQSLLDGLPWLDFLYTPSGQLEKVVFGSGLLSWDFHYFGEWTGVTLDGVLPVSVFLDAPHG